MREKYTIVKCIFKHETSYHIYFEKVELMHLGNLLSLFPPSILHIPRLIDKLLFVQRNNQNEGFERIYEKQYNNGFQFFDDNVDKEYDFDKGKSYSNRQGDTTGYNLGRIIAIQNISPFYTLLYRNLDKKIILIDYNQPLDYPVYFSNLDKFIENLIWWNKVLEDIEEKNTMISYTLNYITSSEEEINLIRKKVDPNYGRYYDLNKFN